MESGRTALSLTKVTHDHRDAERSWRQYAKSAYNSPLEIEIAKSVLRSCSNSTAELVLLAEARSQSAMESSKN